MRWLAWKHEEAKSAQHLHSVENGDALPTVNLAGHGSVSMTSRDTATTIQHRDVVSGTALWLWLSIAAGLLAATGSVIALALPSIYVSLSATFLPQAIAQDIANVAVASPALALRGSLRAYLLWLGVLTFTIYSYVIYTFSIPFGPLFLLWVVVLGLSVYALIGGVCFADHTSVARSFRGRRAITVVGWFLIITGILFALLWLSEDVPALLSGTTPKSLVDMALPTNPVHILDLGLFVPAFIITGVLLLVCHPLAFTLAPALIAFIVLTGVPILLTPVVLAARGDTPVWGVFAPIGTLTLASLGLLAWLLSTMQASKLQTSL
jgi:hypothetical protein